MSSSFLLFLLNSLRPLKLIEPEPHKHKMERTARAAVTCMLQSAGCSNCVLCQLFLGAAQRLRQPGIPPDVVRQMRVNEAVNTPLHGAWL
jgi:hypothetical protein